MAGRGNAEIAILVPTIAAAAGGIVTAVADNDETEFIAATAFFSIARELGNLLNGTDVEIAKDEIFDLTFDSKQQTVRDAFQGRCGEGNKEKRSRPN